MNRDEEIIIITRVFLLITLNFRINLWNRWNSGSNIDNNVDYGNLFYLM